MDSSSVVDSAYMLTEFQLNCSPSVAEINVDTLNGCIDRVITYHYSDGTSSAERDKSREVVSQVMPRKRYLSKNGDNSAIPGTGTLSVGIYVKAATNGTILQPKFMVWMEGNDESYYKSIVGNDINVNAAPKYNVNLTRNTNCNYRGYFDSSEGAIYEDDTAGHFTDVWKCMA